MPARTGYRVRDQAGPAGRSAVRAAPSEVARPDVRSGDPPEVPQHVIAHAVAVAVAVHIVGPAVRGLCEPRLGEPGLGELGGLAPTCTTIITTGLQDRRSGACAWSGTAITARGRTRSAVPGHGEGAQPGPAAPRRRADVLRHPAVLSWPCAPGVVHQQGAGGRTPEPGVEVLCVAVAFTHWFAALSTEVLVHRSLAALLSAGMLGAAALAVPASAATTSSGHCARQAAIRVPGAGKQVVTCVADLSLPQLVAQGLTDARTGPGWRRPARRTRTPGRVCRSTATSPTTTPP